MISTWETAQQILDRIAAYDSVVIFGHENPDGDCVGSVMGLRDELRLLYPQKKIYGVGTHPSFLPSFLPESDEVSLEEIRKSLAVMVDLSDLNRVEDQRILDAKEIVCFDHHLADPTKTYPFLCYRHEDAPSCTFILYRIFKKAFGKISPTVATELYMGMVTDTGRFQFDSDPETFAAAEGMVRDGADYRKLYHELYRQTSSDLKMKAYVYAHFKESENCAYFQVKQSEYEAAGLSSNAISGRVNLLSLLDGKPMWLFFVEQEDHRVRVEFRGDGSRDMQAIATHFGGGGHLCASGCRLPSYDEKKIQEIVDYCDKAPVLEKK